MDYNIKSIKEDFKKKGIFYTPKELAIFIRSFLEEDIKEIYDPTCGDGALLEVFDDGVIKYGQDINGDQLRVAMDKLKNFTGVEGDTLKTPAFIDRKFSHIVANPPFSIPREQMPDDIRFSIAPALPPKSKADYAFILHILSKLTDDGKAVVMGFPGILYRGNSEGKIRQWLVENNYIERIVSIPGDKFIDTKIPTCIIVLSKNRTDRNITFVDSESDKEKSVAIEEIANNDYQLSVNQYIVQDVIHKVIDPVALQEKARNEFLRKLRHELELDKMICGLGGFDFISYLRSLQNVLDEYNQP